MNDTKRLGEYTLEEIQRLCKSRNHCVGCPAENTANYKCLLKDARPDKWELNGAPTLTEQGIAICLAVGAKWVTRDLGANWVCLWHKKPLLASRGDGYTTPSGEDPAGYYVGRIDGDLFPDVRECECVEVPER